MCMIFCNWTIKLLFCEIYSITNVEKGTKVFIRFKRIGTLGQFGQVPTSASPHTKREFFFFFSTKTNTRWWLRRRAVPALQATPATATIFLVAPTRSAACLVLACKGRVPTRQALPHQTPNQAAEKESQNHPLLDFSYCSSGLVLVVASLYYYFFSLFFSSVCPVQVDAPRQGMDSAPRDLFTALEAGDGDVSMLCLCHLCGVVLCHLTWPALSRLAQFDEAQKIGKLANLEGILSRRLPKRSV